MIPLIKRSNGQTTPRENQILDNSKIYTPSKVSIKTGHKTSSFNTSKRGMHLCVNLSILAYSDEKFVSQMKQLVKNQNSFLNSLRRFDLRGMYLNLKLSLNVIVNNYKKAHSRLIQLATGSMARPSDFIIAKNARGHV